MHPAKFKFLLVIAMLMFVAKPFVGFSLRYQHYFRTVHHRSPSILVKSFTKRKQEYADENETSIAKVQQRLNNPEIPSVLLFAVALSLFLPVVLRIVKQTTHSILQAIHYSLASPQQLYLLSGKLTI
jgi:hypothetical protein